MRIAVVELDPACTLLTHIVLFRSRHCQESISNNHVYSWEIWGKKKLVQILGNVQSIPGYVAHSQRHCAIRQKVMHLIHN
jgi:hypothetical protein